MNGVRLFLHYGDMADSLNQMRIVHETELDEVYNLAAQNHVRVSFDSPEFTGDVDALLSGFSKRIVRQGVEEDDTVLPTLAVRRGKALLVLGCEELPRGIRSQRFQRHPLQPRVAT